MSKIYKDLQDIYSNKIDYTINNVEYIFSLNFLDYFAEVKLQNIPIAPRVGEDTSIPYFKEKVHTDSFPDFVNATPKLELSALVLNM